MAAGEQFAVQGVAPPEVVVSFNEQLGNAFLEALFTNLKAPSFRLSAANASASCANEVVLQREIDGVKTAVHFESGRIVAPLAFTGSYAAGLLGCVRFRGWTNALVTLEYDKARQSLRARVAVQEFHLSDLSPRASGLVKGIVQNAIDARVNPIEVFQAAQLAPRVPVNAAGGALRLRLTDVRPEILRSELRLHLFYEFARAE
ncbi:MAG: hypothetical protein ABR577_15395 [Pyrinomonadaceae bacterium]